MPVVSGVVEPEARDTIREVCRKRGSRLVERDTDFTFDYRPPQHLEREAGSGQVVYRQMTTQAGSLRDDADTQAGSLRYGVSFELALPGRHQAANAATALATLDVLRQASGTFPGRPSNGPWPVYRVPARVQVVSRRPAVVLDAAHNVASIRALVETLEESFSAARRLLIFATTHDKDVRGMLQCLLRPF